MGVTLTGPSTGGGRSGASFAYFADDYHRADQPFVVGQQYLVVENPAENFSLTGIQLSGLFNVAGGVNMVVQNAGGPAPCPTLMVIPFRILFSKLWGLKQFAEFRPLSGSAGANLFGVGPAVFMVGNTGTMYTASVYPDGGAGIQFRVERWNNGVITVIQAFRPMSYNDTLRIEIVPGSPHTITIFLNGVQDSQLTDGTLAAEGTAGWQASVILGNNFHLDNFKCGSLPQGSTAANFSQ